MDSTTLWVTIGVTAVSTLALMGVAYYQVRWTRSLKDPTVSPPFSGIKAFFKSYWPLIFLAVTAAWGTWNLARQLSDETPATVGRAALLAMLGAAIAVEFGLLILNFILIAIGRRLDRRSSK